jgi:FkbH-like protein
VEPVRLLIWDLDGVFWKGTLSEGGIRYSNAHHDLVISLAQRGILSSICSKNDPALVQTLLQAHGLWKYFIFPSIDWAPKGARIAALIEAVQLRLQSVLFVDDEAANLAEAVHHVPGIQLSGPEILENLLQDARFQGQDDVDFSRLAQYKILEARRAAAPPRVGDNLAFLRASDIELTIETNVAGQLERAVELINRTNQLNFTKQRLPENAEAAREQLNFLISRPGAAAGLIRLRDRYGDYGVIGFYCIQDESGVPSFEHFCFSCRVLNMGVESFMYAWLGRPRLDLIGETATDPRPELPGLDWIRLTTAPADAPAQVPKILDLLVLRGGCDLDAMAHYLQPLAHEAHTELNTARGNRQFRIDNALFLDLIFNRPSPEISGALEGIGFVSQDWASAMARPNPHGRRTAWVVSFWTDAFVYLYKHKTLDIAAHFLMEGDTKSEMDVTFLPEAQARDILRNDENFEAWKNLREEFLGVGPVFDFLLQRPLESLAQAASGNAMLIVLLAPESFRDSHSNRAMPRSQEIKFNAWLREALAGRPDVHLVEFGNFVPEDTAYKELYHYDRLTYQRAAAHVAELIQSRFGT